MTRVRTVNLRLTLNSSPFMSTLEFSVCSVLSPAHGHNHQQKNNTNIKIHKCYFSVYTENLSLLLFTCLCLFLLLFLINFPATPQLSLELRSDWTAALAREGARVDAPDPCFQETLTCARAHSYARPVLLERARA
ncbi:hypothetical protein JOB18_000943 [Solea senegalensis]|uniref:Uncharacterized protein n=1 Tax=Solea senegalensis TaxID=28829 RepID=A0AAV6R906_SOLSE|nr:hypothetical protein JOB18_000943 [Solea senegalensis]